MDGEKVREDAQESAANAAAPTVGEPTAGQEIEAWEEIEAGRFMPRRIRGSCRGLALG